MILLTWNRDHEQTTWPDYDAYLSVANNGDLIVSRWTVRSNITIDEGEAAFLFVQGEKHERGLVASGWVENQTEPDDDEQLVTKVDGIGAREVSWVIQEMIPKASPVPLNLLEARVRMVKWRNIYYSGFRVPEEAENLLVDLWNEHLDGLDKLV